MMDPELENKFSPLKEKSPDKQKGKRKRKNAKPRVGKINELSIEENCRSRNGIIFYTNYEGERQFLFAIDAKTKQLTDFGGGFLSTDENRVAAAIRESEEETMGVITGLTLESIQGCIGICDHKNLIILVPIEVNPSLIVKAIENRVKEHYQTHQSHPETISATWINGSDLTNCITRRDSNGKLCDTTIYTVVGEFLHKAGNFQSFL